MTARLQLPEKLDNSAIPDFVEALRSNQGKDLVLDASDLLQIGAQSFQAIVVAACDWQDSGHTLSFENASDEVAAQIKLLGTSVTALTEGDIK